MFITEDFLLSNDTARHLYHDHAKKLPIIDYHCHLMPSMVAADYRFRSITELWLGGDHYKWRAMRANGVPEEFITGKADDWSKFQKWAETVPYTLRNPLYHWTHLELKTAFGIDELLTPATARAIYDRCNELLQHGDLTARGLMRHYHVETVCTTDDPCDTLEYHRQVKAEGFEIQMLPAWRPDKAMAVDDTAAYNAYMNRLGETVGRDIKHYDDLLDALKERHDFFAGNGCRVADHALAEVPFAPCTHDQAAKLWQRVREGETLEKEETARLQTALLIELCRMNHEKGWVQQFHIGALRNLNTRGFRALGPDTGYDTIGDWRCAEHLGRLLDALDVDDRLAKTILYNLNPTDNAVLATMIGTFQDGETPGKMQLGSGWWFNDQLTGMRDQIEALSLQGLLSRFVGMLTDSRSFLSYPRHEYFRRLLCDILGGDVERGLIPREAKRVEGMVEDISYYNAKNYFKF
ncbi:MAG: glucuronate isomerase [Prevotellaceae bacterium]|nr:glucuronate isomerase [Prevotellaceae bacterium]